MPRDSRRGALLLQIAKETVTAAIEQRLQARLLELARPSTAAVETYPPQPPASSTLLSGLWEPLILGPTSCNWSRKTVSGVEEFLSASIAPDGQWEITHSFN